MARNTQAGRNRGLTASVGGAVEATNPGGGPILRIRRANERSAPNFRAELLAALGACRPRGSYWNHAQNARSAYRKRRDPRNEIRNRASACVSLTAPKSPRPRQVCSKARSRPIPGGGHLIHSRSASRSGRSSRGDRKRPQQSVSTSWMPVYGGQ